MESRQAVRQVGLGRCLSQAVLPLILLAVQCQALSAGTGTVTAVVDGDTIRVTTSAGRETVRLLGVDTPEPARRGAPIEYFADQATEFTKQRTLGQIVRLEADPQADTRDTYGRALRYVYLADGSLLNADIIAGGYGHAYTRFPYSKLAAFRALEREARVSGRGLWDPARVPILDVKQAADHVGMTATVCGTVASARFLDTTRGRPTFLNLDRRHPDQALTIVIWGQDRGVFGQPELTYAKQDLCITGKIETHKGKPQINARDPSQIAMIPASR